MTFAFEGTLIQGTLRSIDLIPAFMAGLRVLNPEQAARWSDDERRYLNALDGTYAKDPEYTQADVDQLQEESVEFLVTLQDALNEVAPAGYRFGAHEGDGSDFGFWRVDKDHDGQDPMDEQQILDELGEQQGWTRDSKLEIALNYIRDQGDPRAFEDFVRGVAETENGMEHS